MMRGWLFAICFLGAVATGFTQEPVFRHYTSSDGLAGSQVYHIMQDSRGYIWFATDMGASRFDGHSFENFDTDDGLPDNTVCEICEDAAGRIWFVPLSCELSFLKNGKIDKYIYNDSIRKYFLREPHPVKGSFRIDNKDNITLSIYNLGIVTVDATGRSNCTSITKRGTGITVNNSRDIIVSTAILTSDKCTDRLDHYSITVQKNGAISEIRTEKLSKESFVLRDAVINNIGQLIFYFNNEIIVIEDTALVFQRYYPNRILWLSMNPDGTIWVGTFKDGAYGFKHGKIKTIPDYHFLENKAITSVFCDREGSYWFSTLYDGVYFLPAPGFRTFGRESLMERILYGFADGRDKIWAYTNGYRVATIQAGKVDFLRFTRDPSIAASAILFDTIRNLLWIGTNNAIYTLKNGKIDSLGEVHDSLNYISFSIGANNFLLDSTGDIHYTCASGYKIIHNTKHIYSSGPDDKMYIRLDCLAEEKEGGVWLGGTTGLWKYNGNEYTNLGEKNPLLNKRINCMLADKESGILWLGTKGRGLILFREDTIICLTVKDGLCSNSITSLSAHDHTLWVGTSGGLNRLVLSDRNNLSFELLTITDKTALPSAEVHAVYATDTLVYVATSGGLTFFAPDSIRVNNTPPPVYITRIRINDRDTVLKEHYTLPYNMNYITIEYAGLAFRDQSRVRYSCMLEGADKKPDFTSDRLLKYPVLPPGDYTFRVFAVNEDGCYSLSPARIVFTINEPFWKTLWFYSLVTLIIIALIVTVFLIIQRVKIKEIRKRNKLMTDLNRFRQQAMSQQMNPHFIFNTLNSISYFIFKNDKIASNEYLSMFADLMRKTLDNSQHASIPVGDELKALELYLKLEALRFNNMLEYEIIVDEEIDLHNDCIPTLLIQPYVENSIIHGLANKKTPGRISVELRLHDEKIVCIVEDDGIGRKKAAEIKAGKTKTHQSLGTKITESRLKLLNTLYGSEMRVVYTDLTDNEEGPAGTRVEISIPVISREKSLYLTFID
ncbi:MAG: histidine kinase [Bacteroidetes bacterium]|nr:histidine kinase [Bacteroidota bacterium]